MSRRRVGRRQHTGLLRRCWCSFKGDRTDRRVWKAVQERNRRTLAPHLFFAFMRVGLMRPAAPATPRSPRRGADTRAQVRRGACSQAAWLSPRALAGAGYTCCLFARSNLIDRRAAQPRLLLRRAVRRAAGRLQASRLLAALAEVLQGMDGPHSSAPPAVSLQPARRGSHRRYHPLCCPCAGRRHPTPGSSASAP